MNGPALHTGLRRSRGWHHAGIGALKRGVRFNEIDDVVNPLFEEAGYLDDRTFGTGHSFDIMSRWCGRDEIGGMRPYNDRLLEKNLVVSMEPMISVKGRVVSVMQTCC